MRKYFVVFLFCILSIAETVHAQAGFPKTIWQRSQSVAVVQAQGAPYMTALSVNVSAANWGRPDSFVVSGVYFARATTMKFKPMNGDTLSMPFDSLCGLPLAIDTIYTTGTDAGSRTNKIFVVGFYRYTIKDTTRKY